MPDRPLLICDLDETLIAGNSFRLLIVELARPRAWWSLGPAVPLHLARLIALRATRRLDRVSFKRRTHALVQALPSGRRAQLADRMAVVLRGRLRAEVCAAVDTAREAGYITLLATAAFDDHARPLAAALGFDRVVATTWPSHPQDWTELSGRAKRDAVSSSAAGLGAGRPWVLLSDHADDEPLADLCDQVFWVDRRTPLRPAATNEAAFTPMAFSDGVHFVATATDLPTDSRRDRPGS